MSGASGVEGGDGHDAGSVSGKSSRRSLLIALAQILGVTIGDLLGMRATRKPASISTRLERRIKRIERMPAKPKQQLLGIIDTFIAAHQ